MEVNLEELIGEISKSVDVSKQDKSQFEQILRTFLQDSDNTIKIFHLHLFQYLPLSDKADKKGEQDIARFLLDVLLGEKKQ
ncbi:hypothetical protein ACT7CZ_25815 [Bacillus cereus]